ncbi:MAG: sec-independent protein translocase protein TatC [Halobacteriales archaeon]|jgi:sec-independent protein translocase protein TatC
MAEESEPEESSTLPDEEGTDRSTGDEPDETPDEPPAAEQPSDADGPDGSEAQGDADRTDDPDEGSTPSTDETGADESEGTEAVVDPLGHTGPRPEEWIEEDGEGGTESAGQERDGDPAGLDDRDADDRPPAEAESEAGIVGPLPPEDAEVVGPLPREEAEPLKPDRYGSEPLGDETEESGSAGQDDYLEQYREQEHLAQESLNQEYREPTEEVTIEEPETGVDLDREGEGPPDDREMPLTEHVEEMVWRLGAVVVTAAVVTILAYPFSEGVTLHVWAEVLPTADAPDPHLYGPLEKVLTQIKVAGLAGILIALPMVVYQTYRFMRPGLYPHERRYYLAAVPTSLVLAALGMAFSYFLVLPTLFVYFMYYTEDSVDIVAFGLSKTFNLIVTLTGVLAIVFQIPLFIMLAIMMGVTSRRWLASKRIYFWAAFAGASFLIAPDPTGMAPFLVAGTAIGLFEGTLFLLKWVKRGRQRYRRGRESET